jgi:hypothetical protein
MVAEQSRAVDVDLAVRAWLRDVLNVPVFFGVNNDGTFPQIVVMRIAGPDDAVRYQFDVWGGTKDQAAAAAADLASELSRCRHDTADVRLHGASWATTRWFPDPDTDRPRYVVEAVIAATATSPL